LGISYQLSVFSNRKVVDPGFPQFESLGESSEPYTRCLHHRPIVSKGGNLWLDRPGTASRRFHRINITEGCCRKGDVELGRFLQIAMGSASEVECHCLLARDLDFLQPAEYERLTAEVVEIERMLAALISKPRADG
jgi:23S rRNA-intervening sequence protein